jgi:hypothetical protein
MSVTAEKGALDHCRANPYFVRKEHPINFPMDLERNVS